MKNRWTDLYNVYAIYESDAIDIASDFDYYLTKINTSYQSNNGHVLVGVRTSLDNGETWGEWHNVNDIRKVFDGNESFMQRAKFQYKVSMEVDTILGGTTISPKFELFDIELVGAFKIVNHGDLVCMPELWIRKINGSGTVKLTNERNGMSLVFEDLNDGEEVYVDCENEDIVTNIPLTYRYSNHNDVFIELEVGDNYLTGEGDFVLDMRMQFKTLQG